MNKRKKALSKRNFSPLLDNTIILPRFIRSNGCYTNILRENDWINDQFIPILTDQ